MKKHLNLVALALVTLAILSLTSCPPTIQASTDASLASLAITNVAISPAFNAEVTEYTATVPYSVDSAVITAAATDSTATLAINGGASPKTVALVAGSNAISVVVTAASGATKTYTVNLTRTVPATDTSLGNLTVSAGRLTPMFSPKTISYEAGVTSTTSVVTVSANAINEFATLTIDGSKVASKDITVSGNTNVLVVVTAENGDTKTYTVAIKPAATATVPVDLLVVESINGTVIEAAAIVVANDQGVTVAGATDLSDANGLASVELAPDAYYSLYSSKTGHAQNAYINFYVDALGSNKITMVNQRLGMTNKVATAPFILGTYVTHDDNFSDVAEYTGQALDTSTTCYLIATVASESAVEATAWSGFGAKIDFDRTPTTFNGIDGIILGDPYQLPSMPGIWVSDFLFDLSGFEVSEGQHKAVIVAYDVANNRCETSQLVEIVNNPVGTSLSAAVFSAVKIDVRSFPVSRGYFGKDTGSSTFALKQFEGRDISYRTQLTFKLTDGATTPANIAIRGFDVFRSNDGTNFSKIGTQHYGALSTGASGVHTYFDTDSLLEVGVTYTYKVVAYTDAANTKTSETVATKLMASFAANLATPLNQAAVATTGGSTNPAFTFTVSNTALWDVAVSDYFYFELVITEKAGAIKYLAKCRYNFAAGAFQYMKADGSWVSTAKMTYATGTITILNTLPATAASNLVSGAAMEYKIGTAYEWDIIGALEALDGTDHPCWFEKATAGGIAKSYGDGYNDGANTMNGRFEFNVTD